MSVHGGKWGLGLPTQQSQNPGGSRVEGVTPTWREVSTGGVVRVEPTWATCGTHRRKTIYLDRSKNLQDSLYKTLLGDMRVLPQTHRTAQEDTRTQGGSSFTCTTCTPCPPTLTRGQGRPLEVYTECGRPTQEGGGGGRRMTDPCLVDLKEVGCPARYTMTMWVRPKWDDDYGSDSPRFVLGLF